MLDTLLSRAIASTDRTFGLADSHRDRLDLIKDIACSGANRSALAVTCTLLYKKITDRQQDIRLHQAGMSGGFSGRGLDQREVTPFLRKSSFPYMRAGSGWLTRSFEQNVPYGLDYPGRIKPQELKAAFLSLIESIEVGGVDPESCLLYLFRQLEEWRQSYADLMLAKPQGRRIKDIIALVEGHWASGGPGAAKLPTMAVYASYSCLLNEISRYRDCELLPLLSHTSSDVAAKRLGDIEIISPDGQPFEAVEVKHQISVTYSLVDGLSEKIIGAGLKTFYILTTSKEAAPDARGRIDNKLLDIYQQFGCQVIVDSVASAIEYQLRILKDGDRFLNEYVRLVEEDEEISFDLKAMWNEMVHWKDSGSHANET